MRNIFNGLAKVVWFRMLIGRTIFISKMIQYKNVLLSYFGGRGPHAVAERDPVEPLGTIWRMVSDVCFWALMWKYKACLGLGNHHRSGQCHHLQGISYSYRGLSTEFTRYLKETSSENQGLWRRCWHTFIAKFLPSFKRILKLASNLRLGPSTSLTHESCYHHSRTSPLKLIVEISLLKSENLVETQKWISFHFRSYYPPSWPHVRLFAYSPQLKGKLYKCSVGETPKLAGDFLSSTWTIRFNAEDFARRNN